MRLKRSKWLTGKLISLKDFESLVHIFYENEVDFKLLEAAMIDNDAFQDSFLKDDKLNPEDYKLVLREFFDCDLLKLFVRVGIELFRRKETSGKVKSNILKFFNFFEDLEESIIAILREEQAFNMYWIFLLSKYKIQESKLNIRFASSNRMSEDGKRLLNAYKTLFAHSNDLC